MDFSFYHLDRHPFPPLQAREQLFWGAGHTAALHFLTQGVTNRQRFMVLLGEAGVGKTAVLRAYLAGLDTQQCQAISLVDLPLSLQEMLMSIAKACGLTCATADIHVVADQLCKHLVEASRQNRQIAVIIDNAQNLSVQTLWNLRTLIHLVEKSAEGLLQIIFVGRPEFEHLYNLPELRFFQDRLTGMMLLAPLTLRESKVYIRHHFRLAGAQTEAVLTKAALQQMARRARGIPQMLDASCVKVLHVGVLCQEKPISVGLVQEVLGDAGPARTFASLPWGAALFAVGLLIGLYQRVPYSRLVALFDPRTPPASVQVMLPRESTGSLQPVLQAPALPRTTLQETQVSVTLVPRTLDISPRDAPVVQAFAVLPSPPRPVPGPTPSVDSPSSNASGADCSAATPRGKTCVPLGTPRVADSPTRPKPTGLATPLREGKSALAVPASVSTSRPEDIAPRPKAVRVPAAARDMPPAPRSGSTLSVTASRQGEAASPRVAMLHPATNRAPEASSHRDGQTDVVAPLRPLSPELPGPGEFLQTDVVCVTPPAFGSQGKDIVLMDYAGRSARSLIADGALNLAPALSPDGRMLAYTSYRDGLPNLYLRNLVTTQESRLTYGQGLALSGAWSPNGRYLAFSHSIDGNSDIYLYDVKQQQVHRLTTHDGMDIAPSFAPDSFRIVFTSDRSGALQLYLGAVDGRAPRQLTLQGPANTSPAWAPEGETIAFVGQSENDAQDLYVIQANGTGMQRLTHGRQFQDAPAWAPDGRFVMGSSLQNDSLERYLVRVDGTNVIRLVPQAGPVCLAPQWIARHDF